MPNSAKKVTVISPKKGQHLLTGTGKAKGARANTFKERSFRHFPAGAFSFRHGFGESEKLLHPDGQPFAVHGNFPLTA